MYEQESFSSRCREACLAGSNLLSRQQVAGIPLEYSSLVPGVHPAADRCRSSGNSSGPGRLHPNIPNRAGLPGRKEKGTPGRKEMGTPGRKEKGTPGRKEKGTPGRKEKGTPGRKEKDTPGRKEQTDVSLLLRSGLDHSYNARLLHFAGWNTLHALISDRKYQAPSAVSTVLARRAWLLAGNLPLPRTRWTQKIWRGGRGSSPGGSAAGWRGPDRRRPTTRRSRLGTQLPDRRLLALREDPDRGPSSGGTEPLGRAPEALRGAHLLGTALNLEG